MTVPSHLVLSGVAVVALTVATLLFVLLPLMLDYPAPGLDSSWVAVLARAASLQAHWGADLAFTYGPASTLVTRFYTDRYLYSDLPILCCLALANGAALTWLVRDATGPGPSGALLTVVATGVLTAGLAAEILRDQDGFYFVFCLTLVVVDLLRRPGDRGSLLIVLVGATLTGVMAMSKTSYGVLALVLFFVADARVVVDRFAAPRRLAASNERAMGWAFPRAPVATAIVLMAGLATYLAYGQRIGDLPAFLDLQAEVAAGYGEAMYLPPRPGEMAGFLLGAAGLLVIVAVATPSRIGLSGRGALLLSTAAVLAVSFKAGFIRADSHTQMGWTVLGLASLLVSCALLLPRSIAAAASLASAALVVLWVVGPLFLLVATDSRPVLGQLPEIYGPMRAALQTEVEAWGALLRDPSGFAARADTAKDAAWSAVRTLHPLPALQGRVDMIPSEQSAVLASGLDYDPRPSFQDYSSYTAGLIRANAAFYAGPRAPDWVLFDGSVLDDRYPTTGEGALWPVLLRDYEPVRRIGDWLALHRRTVPLPEVLGEPVRRAAPLGSPVDVPVTGPVFVRVTVEKTLLGRLAAAVFRPPALSLRVALASGKEQTYRFIPAIGAAGFLLSPVVGDPDGFALLATASEDLADIDAVRSLVVEGAPWAGAFYGATMRVDFQAVTVAATTSTPEASAYGDDLRSHGPWRHLVRAHGRDGDLHGNRLSAPAPSVVAIPAEGHPRLHVEFGLEDSAWSVDRTPGVCFALTTSPGAVPPFWQRCLDPAAVPADRGPQSADLDLPAGLLTVHAATACRAGCDAARSYWSGIVPRD